MRLLFILFFVPCTSLCQINIKGKIVDSKKNGLPLTNIVCINKYNVGTITNEMGEFELQNISDTDTLKITNIAFIPLIISVNNFINGSQIILIDRIKTLDSVIVTNLNFYKSKLKLGFDKFSTRGTFKLAPGSQLAIFIENPTKREGWIKNVVFKAKDLGKCKNDFRIRFLEIDEVTLQPSYDLNKQNIIIASKSLKKKNVIDVSNYKISMPATGVFVVVEWLTPNINCDKNSYSTIVGNLELPNDLVWFNFRDGKWSHGIRPSSSSNGKFITPNIGIEVAF